jgi:hypothetical protein
MYNSKDKSPKSKMKLKAKGAKSASGGGKLAKADWKKMPKNKQGVITNDTIRKTRASKGMAGMK